MNTQIRCVIVGLLCGSMGLSISNHWYTAVIFGAIAGAYAVIEESWMRS